MSKETDAARNVSAHINPGNLLEVRNLEVNLNAVRGVVHAVRDINLAVRPGEIHGLVGESGCGKSMTAKAIMRLNDESTTIYGGQVNFEGVDLLSLKEKEMVKWRQSQIAMIFQDPETALNPLRTVGSQIAEKLRLNDVGKKEAYEKALSLLEAVGIHPAEQRIKAYPFELSGGMLQRVSIAMALACDPRFLIADEPTTALDVTVQLQILRLLKELQGRYEMAILLITHNFGVIAEICDRVSVMYAGIIVEYGSVTDIFHDARHPYTVDLIASIPKSGANQSLPKSIPGTPPDLRERIVGCPYAPRCRYAEERCRSEAPALRKVSDGHRFACHKDITALRGEEA